jgi:hypothetical protein
VDVRFDKTVTDDERAAVEAWVATHDFQDVDHVTVGIGAVVVRGTHDGPHHGKARVAIRYHGRLIEALDEALANLTSGD